MLFVGSRQKREREREREGRGIQGWRREILKE